MAVARRVGTHLNYYKREDLRPVTHRMPLISTCETEWLSQCVDIALTANVEASTLRTASESAHRIRGSVDFDGLSESYEQRDHYLHYSRVMERRLVGFCICMEQALAYIMVDYRTS